MIDDGWRVLEAIPLQLHRVWKNTRHAPKRKERILVLEQGEGVPRTIRRGHRRTFAQVLRQSIDDSAEQRPLVEVPVWLRELKKVASGIIDSVNSMSVAVRCSPAIGNHLQGPVSCEFGCGRRGTGASMRAHVLETREAASHSVLDRCAETKEAAGSGAATLYGCTVVSADAQPVV